MTQREALKAAEAPPLRIESKEEEEEAVPLAWEEGQVDRLLALYDEQDRRLVESPEHDFGPTSKWWRNEIEAFFRTGKRRWIIRVGRRGFKSETICRLLVCWGLSGMWRVKSGVMATVPIISKDLDEARGRIFTIKQYLDALGIAYKGTETQIAIPEKRLIFRVFAAKSVVGKTSIAIFADEMAEWRNEVNGANPAKQVMAKIRPSAVTQRMAFEICASSPWGGLDYHAELFDLGDTPHQKISYAPTWVANDNYVTEEQTRIDEPDPILWMVSYLAVPGSFLSQAFDPALVKAAFNRTPTGDRGPGWVAIDTSRGRNDTFAVAAGHVTSDGCLVVTQLSGWEPNELPQLPEACGEIARVAMQQKTFMVFGDAYEQTGPTSELGRHGILYVPFDWTNPSKDSAFVLLRRLMREGKLCVTVEHARLKRELERCPMQLNKNGKAVYETNGLDYLATLVTVAHAVNDGRLRLDASSSFDWGMHSQSRGASPKFVDVY